MSPPQLSYAAQEKDRAGSHSHGPRAILPKEVRGKEGEGEGNKQTYFIPLVLKHSDPVPCYSLNFPNILIAVETFKTLII